MDYDIVVVGGGPGGYVAAIKAAQMGKKTCIIEKASFGGVCLNEGCIPTKTLIKTANLLHEIKRADEFAIEGIDVSKLSVSMEKLNKRKNMVVKTLVNGVSALLRKNKVTVVNGEAEFKDKNTLVVDGKNITSDYFIIATGSEAVMPTFIEYAGKTNILTSREALDLTKKPKDVVIIGGGVIGVEFAHVLSSVGSKVYVIELMPNILPMVDKEIALMAQKRLEKQNVVFNTDCKVKKIDGKKVIFTRNGKEEVLEVETVIMAVGRAPVSKGIEKLGLKMNKNAIATDLQLKTSIDNIYAIGDVNGVSMLAHTASHEGIIAVENICGHKESMNYDYVPSCIYLEPELASIGITEEQAKEKGLKVKVGRFAQVGNGKSLVEGDTDGMIKVILEEQTGEILGVHMMAKHATDMISEICVAMNLESTGTEILKSIHPHPTVSESIGEAFMSAVYGKAIHG